MKQAIILAATLALSGCFMLSGEKYVVTYTAGVESAEPFEGEHTFKLEASVSGR